MNFTAFSTWKNIFTEWEIHFTLETTLPLRKEILLSDALKPLCDSIQKLEKAICKCFISFGRGG